MRTKAFTMAEVLITVGIIGVVAAMTLPGVIEGYKKVQTVNQLKKVYSTMQQALQKAEVDHEHIEFWDFSLQSNKFFEIYIRPYYKILHEFNNNDFPFTEYELACNRSGNCNGYGTFNSANKIILNDGTLLAFSPYRNTEGERAGFIIIVDLNGLKLPNRYGRDVFMFSAQPKFGIQPYGIGSVVNVENNLNYDREYLLNGENRSCKYDGIYCAALIMTDNWEIKKDYPW